ncbi:NAD-dependent epimerase/dehydratase family protein [Roseisalinus antarcticus]|uniref:NAD dependent epimerase/dehydratase family protein n=1 Tax=Roseisalinus antarcticus TaxID=254357 RepID=A0A1Y5SS43_9RHOB|nr:NAD-dependent epimerase/dehydratase family protein [Roseisalinus antarcticus]SLN45266.1 NAD dependent epimerase/dehydratase family protein [Roseisalinus antarcticus]
MTQQTVLLTGISGFLAKRIARELLDAGHVVRGTVRSATKAAEVRTALGPDGLDRLSFVTLDLNRDDGWAQAMAGVDALVHTASPFPMSAPKDERETIRPAVDGTLRALRAADTAGVRRVVLTASMVTMIYAKRLAGHAYGPSDWTDVTHPAATAYVKSKTLAEKAAWDFVSDHPRMQLTTIHPGLVVGTPMDRHFGTSMKLVERILSGKDPMQPDLGLPVVDLGDASALHLVALERPETIGERLVAADSVRRMPQIAKLFAESFPHRKIATKTAPWVLLRLLGLFDPALRGILPDIGRPLAIDNSATRQLLGRPFVASDDALLKSAQMILDADKADPLVA